MATGRLNVAALYAALDAERRAREMSWRQIAKECGLSPSTFSRLANGLKPDVDAFAAMTSWLNQDAEIFIEDPDRESRPTPDLVAELAPLLRARHDLKPEDVEYLEDVIAAAVRRFAAERERS